MQRLLPHPVELPVVVAPRQVTVSKGHSSIGVRPCPYPQEVILPVAGRQTCYYTRVKNFTLFALFENAITLFENPE